MYSYNYYKKLICHWALSLLINFNKQTNEIGVIAKLHLEEKVTWLISLISLRFRKFFNPHKSCKTSIYQFRKNCEHA